MKKIRKILFALACVGILCMSCAVVVFAEEYEVVSVDSGTCGDNLTWTLDDEGTLTISGTGEMEDYDALTPWYSNRTIIKKVVISDGVTTIGNYAFMNCTSLESITIPNNVISVGTGAFGYSSGNSACLKSITVLNKSCELVEGFVPSKTTIYGYKNSTAEQYASKKGNSFSDLEATDESGTNVTNESGISVTNESGISVTNESDNSGIVKSGTCGTFLEWTLDSEGTLKISGLGAMDYGTFAPWSRDEVKNVIISHGVTTIANYAFMSCSNLKSITIPNSVMSIGQSAFSSCDSLTSITIPQNVKSIGFAAFESCDS